jgi:hypothetical protein
MIPTSIDSRKITNRRLAYSDDLSARALELDKVEVQRLQAIGSPRGSQPKLLV